MIIDTLTFVDPDDFKISPRTTTDVQRALSGKVYGSKTVKRDELVITFDSLARELAVALNDFLYELTAFEPPFRLTIHRPPSAVGGCTNGFNGMVEYMNFETSSKADPRFERDMTFTFRVHSYEAF